jgi:DNA-binding CsgD family transcriptional regulator
MNEDVIDRIYEAALVPELWPDVLDAMSAISGSAGGALLVTDDHHPPRWSASDVVAPSLRTYIAGGAWKNNKRPKQLLSAGLRGFSRDVDVWSAQEIERYRMSDERQQHGLGWQLGTVIPMPSGEIVIITLDRRIADGPHDVEMREAVDPLFPHLARAGLLASRLGMERARTAVATLEALNLPAAVTTASGHVLVQNALWEASKVVLPSAHGGVSLPDASADDLLRDTFSGSVGGATSRSIPIAGGKERSPAVVHVMPLAGSAHDIFMGAAVLLIVTEVTADRLPDLSLLHGLFDLTPSEARLAAALASGETLAGAAESQGIRSSTARSYLESIFRKTGVRQQSQLVALLNSTRSF